MHHIKKISLGACSPTPLAKRMAWPCAESRFAPCKFPNMKKKILGSFPAKSWGRHCINTCI